MSRGHPHLLRLATTTMPMAIDHTLMPSSFLAVEVQAVVVEEEVVAGGLLVLRARKSPFS